MLQCGLVNPKPLLHVDEVEAKATLGSTQAYCTEFLGVGVNPVPLD
jgi:hypothetical protein